MSLLHTPEALAKKAQTIANNLPQVALLEETETTINVDYQDKKVYVWTNRATVMNRMARKGFTHSTESTLDGQVCDRAYTFELNEISKVASAGLFK